MPEQQKNGYGLSLKGLVMDKGTWTNKQTGEVNHQVHIAVPGQSGTVQVGCTPDYYAQADPLKEFDAKIQMNTNRDGRAFFSMVA